MNHHQTSDTSGAILYKYCTAERMDILRNRQIRFTQGEQLNDIFEMKPTVDLDEKAHNRELKKLAESHNCEIEPSTREKDVALVYRTLEEALVLSLSSEWNLIPMWSYYADGHKGLVIGFNRCKQLLSDAKQVNYTNEYPVVTSGFADAIFNKHEQWRHESEWRSLRVLSCSAPDQTLCKDIHLYRFSPDTVAEVIIGHRMTASDRCMVLESLNDPEYDHVKRFEICPDQNQWRLQKRRLGAESKT